MFKDIFEHEFTWIAGFLRNVRRFPTKCALTNAYDNKKYSYLDLDQISNQLSNALINDNVKKNTVVMYMLPNIPEFVFCYLACHKIQAIGSPVNFRLAPGELALIFEDSKPHVFFYDKEFSIIVETAIELSKHKPKHIIAIGNGPSKIENECNFSDYIKDKPNSAPNISTRPHIYDETTRLYTSGTTSRAKAVPINNINEVLSAHDVMMHFPLNSTDKTMNMTPWFHRGGLHSGGITPTLYAGGEIIALRDFHPRNCLKYVQKYKITFLIGVPSILALLSRAQEHNPANIASLKGIVTMGSPLDKIACQKYREVLTPNIFNGYGTTETFWNTFLRPYNLPDMAGSAGQACTDDEVRIVKTVPNGHAEPDDLIKKDNVEVGEIIIRSPAKSAFSYVNNDEMTKQKFYKGYLYTGDLGTWDEQECITIVSRKDDMIVCAGENIYPAPIEAVLNDHPKVLESAVIGEKDRLHGQCVAAYIVAEDKSLTIEELRNYCANHPMLPPYKRPKYYTFVDELPHTATGKLKHYALRKLAKKS